ncbi:ABC transporter substrate-binding protein [Halococcus sp. IIIV-5B]|uniref:ABC transporter substrate-binding protein n=1 Tax=Halococcus sp. IIIV-5B TaxID=2321230 RepID=UPI000E72871C|nr:ABC transporter substrate-binding protein [Halococcus sp. IIIV-5B]RJT04080.1 ABC transporter substrate-binding protein [Halococcus sp. IIIV-5B]
MTKDTKQTRRRFLKATGGVAAGAALAGCSSGSGDGSGNNSSGGGGGNNSGGGNTSAGNQSGGNQSASQQTQSIQADPSQTLQLINDTITTFDPVAATDTASGTVIQNVFDALTNYPNANIAVEPQLASDFSVSDDNTTYTFQLKDATFHNGKTVTAQDFIYAWERLAASSNSQRAYFILDSVNVQHETTTQDGNEVYKPNSLALEAPDEKTLEVTLESPFHSTLEMFAYTSFAAVPEGIVGDIEGYDGEMNYQQFSSQNPVGAGPFQFDSYESGTSVDVTRFDDYHDGRASIAGIHWQVISQASSQYQYFIGKNADAAQPGMPTSQYDPSKVNVQRGPDDQGRTFGTYGPLENGATVQYMSVPTINTYYVGFNMAKVPKPVRQAFAYVANQQQVTEQVFKGRGEPAYHLTPPGIYPGGSKSYDQHAKQNYPYGYNQTQVPQATQVMEDAGYDQNNTYSLQWTQYESDTWLSLGKLFRDQLQAAHIDMQIQQADFSTLLERGANGQLEVYTLGWVADWPAPDNFVQLLNPPQTDTSQSDPISYINWTGENGDAAQQATNAYKRVSNNQAPTDQAEQARDKAYIAMEEANWEDVGFINLYHQIEERFIYNWVEYPPMGAMGTSRDMKNDVKIASQRN